MWWLLVLIVVALIFGMVVPLNRCGQGDPSFRPDDPRGGESLGGPGGPVGATRRWRCLARHRRRWRPGLTCPGLPAMP